ncbi:MAG: DUF6134 family protein [Kiloniellales bacterium]
MDRRTTLKLAGGALAGLLLPTGPAFARRPFPEDGAIHFSVLRHGGVIGEHAIRFSHENGHFIVRTDVTVDAGAPGVRPYRYEHHAEEVWADGWLHAVTSDTDDDGRLYRLRAGRRDGVFGGAVNGRAFTVSGYIVPSSLWHRDTPASEALLDTIDGRVKIVRGRLLGTDEVAVRGKPVNAKHDALSGQIQRDLWYDSECHLVRVAFLGRDGSGITLEPR